MSALVISGASQAQAHDRLRNYRTMTLEQILNDLWQFGEPRVGCFDSGWHAYVKMRTNRVGSDFEVKSEFGMNTPIEATRQLAARVLDVLEGCAK